jgi:CTP synthase
VATQAHPELKSRPTRPHPLFAALISAALKYMAAERLPVDVDGELESDVEAGERVAP